MSSALNNEIHGENKNDALALQRTPWPTNPICRQITHCEPKVEEAPKMEPAKVVVPVPTKVISTLPPPPKVEQPPPLQDAAVVPPPAAAVRCGSINWSNQ